MNVREFAAFRKQKTKEAIDALNAIKEARNEVRFAPVPENIRAATAEDIKAGVVIWYPDGDEQFSRWAIIEEINKPGDPFEAFSFEGCWLGLNGAFVEAEETV